MHFDEIDDPKGMCKNVTDLGRWGNGDVEVGFNASEDLEYIMFLVQQSFEKYSEGEGWKAYKQFCQHFLGPLALMAHTDIRLNKLFQIPKKTPQILTNPPLLS